MPKAAGKRKRTPATRPRKSGSKPDTSPQATPQENEWFELRRSAIQGLGAFARKAIPKGTRIIEYTGERISNAEADRRYDDAKMGRHHTFLFTLTSRTVVDAAVDGNEARFINHSCDPNCEAVIEDGRIWIEAIRRIPEGTELVYDYQYEHDEDYTQEDLDWYACRCGAANCRGTIVKVNPRYLARMRAKERAAVRAKERAAGQAGRRTGAGSKRTS